MCASDDGSHCILRAWCEAFCQILILVIRYYHALLSALRKLHVQGPPLIVQRKISVDRRDHIRICPLAGQKLNYHHSELAVQSKEKAVVFGESVR